MFAAVILEQKPSLPVFIQKQQDENMGYLLYCSQKSFRKLILMFERSAVISTLYLWNLKIRSHFPLHKQARVDILVNTNAPSAKGRVGVEPASIRDSCKVFLGLKEGCGNSSNARSYQALVLSSVHYIANVHRFFKRLVFVNDEIKDEDLVLWPHDKDIEKHAKLSTHNLFHTLLTASCCPSCLYRLYELSNEELRQILRTNQATMDYIENGYSPDMKIAVSKWGDEIAQMEASMRKLFINTINKYIENPDLLKNETILREIGLENDEDNGGGPNNQDGNDRNAVPRNHAVHDDHLYEVFKHAENAPPNKKQKINPKYLLHKFLCTFVDEKAENNEEAVIRDEFFGEFTTALEDGVTKYDAVPLQKLYCKNSREFIEKHCYKLRLPNSDPMPSVCVKTDGNEADMLRASKKVVQAMTKIVNHDSCACITQCEEEEKDE